LMLGGFRYLSLDSQLGIDQISVFGQNLANFPVFQGFAGNTLRASDTFAVHNRFYGGQVGGFGQVWPGGFGRVIGVGVKLALGATVEELDISGSQLRTLANGTQVFSPAGVLALPSNIGNHRQSRFSQVPEFDLKVSVPLGCHLTLSTGFSMLYWSRL